jgi:four helix bundle protein
MARGDDIRERLVGFAVTIMDLCDRLPKTTAGGHVANQLLRSGTSAAPNYAEARAAESTRDFVHKLGVALKELNEAEVWLDIVARRSLVPGDVSSVARRECSELCRILAASVRTARSKLSPLYGN